MIARYQIDRRIRPQLLSVIIDIFPAERIEREDAKWTWG
jgi:hypothetical protein